MATKVANMLSDELEAWEIFSIAKKSCVIIEPWTHDLSYIYVIIINFEDSSILGMKRPILRNGLMDFLKWAGIDLEGSRISRKPTTGCVTCPYIISEPARAKSDTIYFVAALAVGLVKIGCASDPVSRIAEHQISSPVLLTLLATTLGSRGEEHALHRRFASLRKHGEWFRMEGKLKRYIESICERSQRNGVCD